MLIEFYAEDLAIPLEVAKKVAWFVSISKEMTPNPWAKHGLIRVYFEPWSQNSLPVFKLADKWFFDAVKNEVYLTGFFYSCCHLYTLKEVICFDRGNFSGSKTKKRLIEFSKLFYGEKTYWD